MNVPVSTERFDYAGQSGIEYHERRHLPPIGENWISAVRAAKIQPLLHESDSVFEYGVGFGWNLSVLRCREKVGFDVTPGLREVIESKHIKFVDDPAQLAAGTFDVVICHHTLEHLKHPASALEVILSLLKPKGTLLLFAPYEIERKYRKYDPSDRARHLYSWTPMSLSHLVVSTGFELTKVRLQVFRFDRAAATAALRFKLGETGYRVIRRVAQLLLPEYEISIIATRPAS